MKGHQKVLLCVAMAAFIVWVSMLGALIILSSTKSDYSSWQEVQYIGENVIQNNEGTIYEYEYEFELDSHTIYYHSNEKMEFESKEMVIYKEGQKEIIFESQMKERFEVCKNAEEISRIILLISVVVLVAEFFVEEKVIKKRKNEKTNK